MLCTYNYSFHTSKAENSLEKPKVPPCPCNVCLAAKTIPNSFTYLAAACHRLKGLCVNSCSMCSSFYHMPSMENYQGDLGDIVRAGSGAAAGQSLPEGNNNPLSSTTTSAWQFPTASDPINHNSFSEIIISDVDYFGDPFSASRDPLLHELGGGGLTGTTTTTNSSSSFFSSGAANLSSSPSGVSVHEKISGEFFGQAKTKTFDEDRQMKMNSSNTTCNTIATRRPNCNFFSRMLQISPNNIMANRLLMPISPCHDPSSSVKNHLASPREILNASSSFSTSASSSLVSGDTINANASNSGVQQILSPRNPAIKRRKSQAKKVVCIPAPAPANSRPSGEVVPSDLWAWRKYGQKPIKGSPYPRGYYRCSSSKGCSARKQVERSRTDPNMLVITYTSEHNHPWPTQRNALAGSTRSQPSKTNTSKNPSSISQQTPSLDQSDNNNLKEEPKEMSTSDDMNTSNNAESIKEEAGGDTDHNREKLGIMNDDSDQFNDEFTSYKPTMPLPAGSNHSSEDFFADLGEIETESIDLLLNPVGFTGNEIERDSKQGLDPFSFLDWPSGHNNINTSSASVMASGQEARRGL